MSEEPKKSLEDWGIDVEKFKVRAKESIENARGDLSEITGTLRATLVQAKDILVGMQKSGSPAAAELKSGFERAWHEIESAFRSAREKAKSAESAESAESPESAKEPESAGDNAPTDPPSPS